MFFKSSSKRLCGVRGLDDKAAGTSLHWLLLIRGRQEKYKRNIGNRSNIKRGLIVNESIISYFVT